MPVLSRRQQNLVPHRLINIKPSIEHGEAMGEPLWAVEEDYERPQKEIDFPMAPLGRVPSRKDSMNNLRINTYTSGDLHDRYMESEEEPSPSPDSENESNDEELKHKTPTASTIDTSESVYIEESRAEIATAVPIMAVGKPKLVNITNLAPMYKRKRAEKPLLPRSTTQSAASRPSAVTHESSPPVTSTTTRTANLGDYPAKRQDGLSTLAHDSWLPDDVTIVEEEDDRDPPDFGLRNPPSYNDYDPYSLDPPCLSPRNSYGGTKKPGSVTRARNSSIQHTQATLNNNGWKGLTRSLSIAKKQTLQRGDHQAAKRPRMVPRAANERENPLIIPSFPLEEKDVD